MHTVVRLSNGKCKVMFVQKNYWTNIAYGLNPLEAMLIANFLNGGKQPSSEVLKKAGKNLTITPVTPDDNKGPS